jgi:hypothetical protein
MAKKTNDMGTTKLIQNGGFKMNVTKLFHICKLKNALIKSMLIPLSILTFSCEINDPVADISAMGFIAANIYWDVPVTNVTAGNEVEFYAEYWSVDNIIEYLGVWYDLRKNLKYTLTHPATGFAFTLDSSELAREFMEIKTFSHSEQNYVAEKKAYVLENSFPVSYTLSSLEYSNPAAFNQEQFNQLIPENVRSQFLTGLFPLLTYNDFRMLLVTEGQVVEEEIFEGYFDTIPVGEEAVRMMKTEAEPQLRAHLSELPFSAFIYNRNRQYYAVEFSQSFGLNVRFRIVNGNQVENFSEAKTITVF